MEMEFFVEPGTDEEWHQYWIDERTRWYVDLGIAAENLRHFEHPKEKLSHYSKRTVDIEYRFGFAGNDWGELEGIANRTDFDLTTHTEHSGVDLSYFDQASGERYVPYVIEPAAGPNRAMMAFLVDAYTEDEAPNTKGGVDKRTVLRLDPRLAPVKVAVLPLSRQRGAVAEGPRPGGRAAAVLERRLRRRPGHRPALPPPGRDRHAVLRHRRLRHARGRRGHHPRARRHDPGAGVAGQGHRLPRQPPCRVLSSVRPSSSSLRPELARRVGIGRAGPDGGDHQRRLPAVVPGAGRARWVRGPVALRLRDDHVARVWSSGIRRRCPCCSSTRESGSGRSSSTAWIRR